MLQVNFIPDVAHWAVPPPSLAPAQSYRVDHDELQCGGTSEILARLAPAGWRCCGANYGGFSLIGAARIHFEDCSAADRSRSFGPFADIRVEAGLIWVIGRQRFASFQQRTRAWHAFALGTDWPVMVFTVEPLGSRIPFERNGPIDLLR